MEKQGIASWPAQTREYIDDLRAEMKRVTWPTWPQVRATTGVVLACVFGFAAYFYVIDLAFGNAVKKLIDTFSR